MAFHLAFLQREFKHLPQPLRFVYFLGSTFSFWRIFPLICTLGKSFSSNTIRRYTYHRSRGDGTSIQGTSVCRSHRWGSSPYTLFHQLMRSRGTFFSLNCSLPSLSLAQHWFDWSFGAVEAFWRASSLPFQRLGTHSSQVRFRSLPPHWLWSWPLLSHSLEELQELMT
jgi:hypothetical protein